MKILWILSGGVLVAAYIVVMIVVFTMIYHL